MRKKKKNSNTPRHKRLNRTGRIQAAKSWLLKYNGKNIVRGYSKHFAVDLLCAVKELEIIGYRVEPKYVEQLKINLQDRLNKARKNNEMNDSIYDRISDEEWYWFDGEIDEIVNHKDEELPF